MWTKRFAIIACFVMLGLRADAQVPQFINYQGRLLDGTNLVNGTVSLSLRLFSVPSSGSAIYEDSNSVTVVDGLYSTFIGDNTTIGNLANALTNSTVFIEVAVNGVALSPRETMVSVPYALRAQTAESLSASLQQSLGVAPSGMVLVPGGTFTMGSSAVGGDAAPEHQVTLSSFYMSKYEVTYGLWYPVKQWAATNGYNFANAGREGQDGTIGAAPTAAAAEPVTTISWRDAIVWCNARSQQEGLASVYTYLGQVITNSVDATATSNAVLNAANNGYRLPTEAEWEYAARYVDGWSWTPGEFASGAGFGSTNAQADDAVAWYSSNSSNSTHVVGTKESNQLALHDISGNMYEWIWDWLSAYGAGTVTNPVGPVGATTNRVLRGGSWLNNASTLRCSARSGDIPVGNNFNVGIRCVRGL